LHSDFHEFGVRFLADLARRLCTAGRRAPTSSSTASNTQTSLRASHPHRK
jgi:hypothetical protein